VIGSNTPQKVPSSLNARKPIVGEISEAIKGGVKRRLALVDEDVIEDNELFQGILFFILKLFN
jgi:hypothetical protein